MQTLATNLLQRPAVATTLRCDCAHCGLEVPIGFLDPDADQQFCCAGCRTVYQMLHTCGLEAYYRLRDASGTPAHPTDSRFASFDSAGFHKLYVRQSSENTSTIDLVLEGVSCAACVWLIERLPHVVPGVIEARLSLRQATVRLVWNHSEVALSRIAIALDQLGYTPHPAKGVARGELYRRELRRRMIDLAVAGALMGNIMLLAFALYAGRFGQMADLYKNFFRILSGLLGTLSLAWPGRSFFRGAIAAIRVRRINLDVPIALALLAGGVAGVVNIILQRGEIYFDTLTVLVLLLLVGRFLQFRQQRFADDALELLFSLAPATCRRIGDDGHIEELPAESLSPGNLVEVRSGDVVPADGIVETGRSSICQALLTGESLPTPVGPGETVFGGAQNQGAALRVRVTGVGEETRIGQLLRVVEQGVSEKPPIVELADRIGAWFTLVICVAAAMTFAFWARSSLPAAIDHTVALLIVTCPCVLGLATPLTIAMAIGQLSKRNILIKRGAALEKLAGRGEMLLDKTGTLTLGNLQMVCFEGDNSLKPFIVALELQSQHPVARALVEGIRASSSFPNATALPPSTGTPAFGTETQARRGEGRGDGAFELSSGLLGNVEDRGDGGMRATLDSRTLRVGSSAYLSRAGVNIPETLTHRCQQLEASGTTVVLAAIDDQAVALAGLADQLREDSASSIASLHMLGWRERIISGDAQAIVTSIAEAVGIDPAICRGRMTPEAKLATVRDGRDGRTIVMVGDGVNDAAALAAADVGIAVHGGAEASLAAADIYIATPGLASLVLLVRAARLTMRTIHRNLAISLAYNVIAGALAAAGKMDPLVAAVLMPISSASVLTWAIASVRRIGTSDNIHRGNK